MAELAFFVLFYSVPFLALFVLRELRWLLIGAAVAVLGMAVFWIGIQKTSGDAAVGAFLISYVATLGFVSGGVGRLLLIAIGGSGRRTAVVGCLFYFGLPLLVKLGAELQEWKFRRAYAPPSSACRERLHEVRLADGRLYLPLMNGFQVWRSARGDMTMFVTPERAREFCHETGSRAPRLTAVTIDFWQLETRPGLRQRPPCDRPRPQQWWSVLCRFHKGKRMDIHSIAIFDPKRFDSSTMASFQLDSGPTPSGTATGASWRRDPNGLWRSSDAGNIWWRGYEPRRATSPWVARCVQQASSLSTETIWRCHSGYRLSDGIALAYDFEAGLDTFAADVARIDGQVSAIAIGLMERDAAVSSRR